MRPQKRRHQPGTVFMGKARPMMVSTLRRLTGGYTATLRRFSQGRRVWVPVRKTAEASKALTSFTKAVVLNPRSMGAFVPSSPYLAKVMASFERRLEHEFVLDLGAGTGVVTKALLRQGVPPGKIIAVERSPALVKHFRTFFPQVPLIEGDATYLSQLLKGYPVGTIISGLPLRSFFRDARRAVIHEIASVLPEGGRYIQFTYDLRDEEGFYPEVYCLERVRYVWRNLPPAKVSVYALSREI